MKEDILDQGGNESIRDGYIEAVVFALYKDGKVLVERRPESNDDNVFIPSGRIEEQDKQEEDYRTAALRREVSEELNVQAFEFHYLTDIKFDKKKLWFYVYIITKWEGELPTYTVEPPGSGQKFADLEWVDVKDYEKVSDYEVAHQISEAIINHFGLE